MAPTGRKRARTVDREAVVEAVNTAYAEGQLSAEERDDKVARALVARHLGELHQVTSDLQVDPEGASGPPAPTRSPAGTRRRWVVGAVAAAALVAGGAVVADQVRDDSPAYVAPQPSYAVPVTAAGLRDLVTRLAAASGSTRSHGVNMQPALTQVLVPVSKDPPRHREWAPTEDGGLVPTGDVRGAGDLLGFDLAEVDLAALATNLERAWGGLEVEEPTVVALVLQHRADEAGPTITINVSNEFEEGGYLVTDFSGRVLQRRPHRVGR